MTNQRCQNMKKKAQTGILLIFSILLSLCLYSQPKIPKEIDRLVLIEPNYENAGEFFDKLAPVQKGGKWGYINANGDQAVDYKFDYAAPFSELYAHVQDGNYYKIINTSGGFLSGKEYDKLSGFSGGLAAVLKSGEKKYVYIDTKETVKISTGFDRAKPFSEDLAAVKKDNKWGYINNSGSYVITSLYEDANSFSDNLAAVKIAGLWGFIDKTGKIIIDPTYERVGLFKDGLCPVFKNGLWGYIDGAGKKVTDFTFEEAGRFAEGMAPVKKNGSWGYIDTKGAWVIEPVLAFAGPYTEGMAVFAIKDAKGQSAFGYLGLPGKNAPNLAAAGTPAAPTAPSKTKAPAGASPQEVVGFKNCDETQSGWQGEILHIHKIDNGTKKLTIRWEKINQPYTISIYKGKGKNKKNLLEKFQNLEYSGFKQFDWNSRDPYLTIFIQAKKGDTQWRYQVECD